MRISEVKLFTHILTREKCGPTAHSRILPIQANALTVDCTVLWPLAKPSGGACAM